MDLNETFKRCLLIWEDLYEGKGSYLDFANVALQAPCPGFQVNDLLERFLTLLDLDDYSLCPADELASASIMSFE